MPDPQPSPVSREEQRVQSWQLIAGGKLGFGCPGILMRAILKCPVCAGVFDVTTYSTELSPWTVKHQQNLEWVVERMADERHCSFCGVAFLVPKAQCEAVVREVKRQVTTAVMAAAVGELGLVEVPVTRRGISPNDYDYDSTGFKAASKHEIVIARG